MFLASRADAPLRIEHGDEPAVTEFRTAASDFVVFVTRSGIHESVPPTDELDDAVVIVGMPGGKLALLWMDEGTVSIIDRQQYWRQ